MQWMIDVYCIVMGGGIVGGLGRNFVFRGAESDPDTDSVTT